MTSSSLTDGAYLRRACAKCGVEYGRHRGSDSSCPINAKSNFLYIEGQYFEAEEIPPIVVEEW